MAKLNFKLIPMTEADLKDEILPRLMHAENRYRSEGGDPTFWHVLAFRDPDDELEDWYCLRDHSGRLCAMIQYCGNQIYRAQSFDDCEDQDGLSDVIRFVVRRIEKDGQTSVVFRSATSEKERRVLDQLGFVAGPENHRQFFFTKSDRDYRLKLSNRAYASA